VTGIPDSAFSTTWEVVDAGFLARVRRVSIVLGLLMAAPLGTYFGLIACGAWVAGLAWSLVNLAAIAAVVRRVLADERDRREIVVSAVVKFPVLYAAGFGLLVLFRSQPMWLVAGFTWPLFVAVMKAAGRYYLRLDEVPGARAGKGINS
jgi:hypothetical protein